MPNLSKTERQLLHLVNDFGPIDAKSIWRELGDDFEQDIVDAELMRLRRFGLVDVVGKCRRRTDIPRYCLTNNGRALLFGKPVDMAALAQEVVEHAKRYVPNSVFAWGYVRDF